MKYAIIGAGGTGGSLGFFLTKAGKDVTLIARGKHLEAIRKNGLGMERLWDHKREMIPVKACTVEEYSDTPDVILVCVKGYSMTETIPVIRKLAGKDTVVLPILNIYGTGGKLQKEFPELTAAGWMYLRICQYSGAGCDPATWKNSPCCLRCEKTGRRDGKDA